jgi:hypothetical protein
METFMMFFILGGMYKIIDVSLLSSNKRKVYELLFDKKNGT